MGHPAKLDQFNTEPFPEVGPQPDKRTEEE
jgi:hypothetical protein